MLAAAAHLAEPFDHLLTTYERIALQATFKMGARTSAAQKLAIAIAITLAFSVILVARALAGTDYWCSSSNCFLNGGQSKASPYLHHSTLAYTRDMTGGHTVGAGVTACYSIAHGYQEASHGYSNPCYAYAVGENAGSTGMYMAAHNDF